MTNGFEPLRKKEFSMSSKQTVACPNCGSTATHNVGVVAGSSPAYCNQCKKGFRIYMKQGRLDQVKKS
jgi:hypothetical protein